MKFETITATELTFLSEGLKLKVFMAEPVGSGPFPAVLINHGGGGMEVTYEQMCTALAKIGYIATAMTFRGYYGSEGSQEYGKGEVRDILNLVWWLKDNRPVDKNRIGMFGYSRGALNTLLSAEQSEDFRAIAVWAAPADLRKHHKINPFIEDLIGGSPDMVPEEYEIRSPINFVANISCPVFIVHGEMDDVIPVEHAYMLAAELKKYHKYFEMKICPGEGHVFWPEAFNDAWRETARFLDKYLSPR